VSSELKTGHSTIRAKHVLFAFALSVSVCLAQTGIVVRAYPLQTSDPSEMIAVITAVIGEKGTVKLDKTANRLVVSASEAQQAEIAAYIKELNKPAGNVRIEVRTQSVFAEDEADATLDLAASHTSTGETIKIKPRAHDRSGEKDSSSSQLLVVASGREAALRITTDEAFVEWLLEYGQKWGYTANDIVRKEVGAKLWIQPTIIGNGPLISIRVTPEISFVVDGRRQLVRYVKASVQVTARDGQPIAIGGSGELETFYRRFLTGLTGSGNSGSTTMTLTPRIMPAFPRPASAP
jgi:type II secretory pathway component GspD/PulD (secretin)